MRRLMPGTFGILFCKRLAQVGAVPIIEAQVANLIIQAVAVNVMYDLAAIEEAS